VAACPEAARSKAAHPEAARPELSGVVPAACCPATSYVSCLPAKRGERDQATY
jgi:hypothetical protein